MTQKDVRGDSHSGVGELSVLGNDSGSQLCSLNNGVLLCFLVSVTKTDLGSGEDLSGLYSPSLREGP